MIEAEDRRGRAVYYTEAPALSFNGQVVAAESLRRWNRFRKVTLRWFTIEGVPPYVELAAGEGLERWGFQSLYRADWPLAWSIPGGVDPAHDDHLAASGEKPTEAFGTLRYQVNVELYGLGDEILPGEQFRSWGVEELRREVGRFPTVHLVLPGRLAAASKVFGLTQIDLPAGVSPELGQELSDAITSSGVSIEFVRGTIIRQVMKLWGLSGEPQEEIETDPGKPPTPDSTSGPGVP